MEEKFRSQFYQICEPENKKSRELFEKLLKVVLEIPVEDGYADYGHRDGGTIEFKLALKTKEDMILTILKPVETDDDSLVVFSLSHNVVLKVLDQEEIDVLKDKTIKLINKLNNHECNKGRSTEDS